MGSFYLFIFVFFIFEISEKCLIFTKKPALSADDTGKYEDDMPGDLSSSYYTWILAKNGEKKSEGQNGKKIPRGCYAKRSFFCLTTEYGIFLVFISPSFLVNYSSACDPKQRFYRPYWYCRIVVQCFPSYMWINKENLVKGLGYLGSHTLVFFWKLMILKQFTLGLLHSLTCDIRILFYFKKCFVAAKLGKQSSPVALTQQMSLDSIAHFFTITKMWEIFKFIGGKNFWPLFVL